MSTFAFSENWIETSWREMGQQFCKEKIPAARYAKLAVDDLAFPIKNKPSQTWMLDSGKLLSSSTEIRITRIPFIAFSIDEDANTLNIQVHWAPRCGYGFEVQFDQSGLVISQKMRWVS
ncbi:hypothetical protein [Kinneretia aquatilis]|uniref:hypothetical protein n=1 Tax=Kinneretia aquatilis TaxID=2070761 RepID=UPI00105705F2|nr:hypothetical protein [Paucibacter aquatile]